MKGCGRCCRRDACRALCEKVEGLLPKELTGKDTHREVPMDTDGFMAVVEMHSYAGWRAEAGPLARPEVDLSRLTGRERAALLLLASGCSQREAASRMKISRYALRSLAARAVNKARVAHPAHLVKGGKPGGTEVDDGRG